MMQEPLKNFETEEDGAVTVDWVVLTAAIVGFGMLVLVPVAFSTDSASDRVGNYIEGVDVGYKKD
jgi:hypothetical protein